MPELHKSDKRRFGFVFVKFHLLPPHLSEASSSAFWQEPLEIPLVLAGIPGSGKVTVTLAVSTEGDTNPAIEGEDFTIDNKEITFEEG